MRIEVDTSKDSKEDIKKVIRMLNHLVEDSMAFNQVSQAINETSQQSYGEMPGLGFMDTPVANEENKEEEKKPSISSWETF
jgi:hypothetical protein